MRGDGASLRRERIESLDALRGVLAIGVMVYHLLIFRYDVHLRSLGTYAVYTFFVLSGFAMRWVAVPPAGSRFPVRSYAVARLARIAPLWWVAVIATVVGELPERPRVREVVENLTFVFAVTPTVDIPLGGWSIAVEVVFYLLFPVFAVFVRSTRALVALVVAAAIVRYTYVAGVWPAGATEPSVVSYQQMPSFLVFFAGGMLVAELRRRRVVRWGHWPLVAAAAVLAGVFALSGLGLRALLAGPLSIALGAACIVAVACASCAPNPVRPVAMWCWSALGTSSYAVYLLHPLVYLAVARLDAGDLATIVVTIVVTLVVSWCSYRWFEVPVGSWIRSRLSPAPVGTRR